MSRDMRLSEAIGWFGLVVSAIASHVIPGWLESQAKFESHVRGVGMGPDFARTGPLLARLFSSDPVVDSLLGRAVWDSGQQRQGCGPLWERYSVAWQPFRLLLVQTLRRCRKIQLRHCRREQRCPKIETRNGRRGRFHGLWSLSLESSVSAWVVGWGHPLGRRHSHFSCKTAHFGC